VGAAWPQSLEERRAIRASPSSRHASHGRPTERDWGGWRVPGAEYDLDPYRIEHQAEVIVRAPIFMKLLEEFLEHAEQEPENLSDDLTKLAQVARRILGELAE
jgi:hypothetical protein